MLNEAKYRIAGTQIPLEVDTRKNLLVAQGSAKYTEAALAGRLFTCAMQTATTTSTSLNTTFVGLALVNPTGSGKIIIVHRFSYAATAALTAETLLGLATTTDSGFAAGLTPRCCRYGYASSIAYVALSATIVAPVVERILCTLGQGADSVQLGGAPPNMFDLDGSMILDPGRAVVTNTTAATGAVMQFGYVWEEVTA
jgi:hypothetical protein